jgi:hypothetical protein
VGHRAAELGGNWGTLVLDADSQGADHAVASDSLAVSHTSFQEALRQSFVSFVDDFGFH